MAATRAERSASGKLKWTDRMCRDVLVSKTRAVELTNSENPPRLDSGRTKGYMYVMKELWDDLGYGELGLTAQNLRDQSARLEKSLGSIKGTMDRQIGRVKDTRFENREESETDNNLCNGDRSQKVV